MFDNCVRTSETSIDKYGSFASAGSYYAIQQAGLGMHATAYHVEDIPHNPRLVANNTGTLKSCGSTVHEIDITREVYIPLTCQALQQHNTKEASTDSDKTTQGSLPQSHVHGTNLVHTVEYTSSPVAYDHASVEPYFYPRRHPQLHIPATFPEEYEYNIDIGTELLHQRTEHRGHYQYPVLIYQEDVNHQMGHLESDVKPLSIKQELFQAPTSCSDALAGIGAQFSA
jgi:hypothetical protein